VSGRGVGLDVVQRNVEELGGELQIESERGRGTTFRLRLPLTLTILDGLLLCAGAETCVLPLSDIAFSLRIAPGQTRSLAGLADVLDLPGETLPLLDLGMLIGNQPSTGATPLAVVVQSGGYRYGLRVDTLLGPRASNRSGSIKSIRRSVRWIRSRRTARRKPISSRTPPRVWPRVRVISRS
jgi:two-component system chemotaxis sensor kinase CheA